MITSSRPLNHAAMATKPQYIVKEDGKNADEAINIPLLGTKNINVKNATLHPNIFFIALK